MSLSVPVWHREGAGPANIVLIHGFGADRLAWVANSPALAARATVWMPDLPGHGATGNDVGDGSAADLARALVAGLPERALVVGHSLGGAVAMHLAALAPDAVLGLVLISPAGLGAAVDPGLLADYPELRTQADAMAALRSLVARSQLIQAPMADYVLQGLAPTGRREALRRVAAAVPEHFAPPVIQPCRYVWGDSDGIIPLSDDLRDRLGDALTVLRGTGHLPQVEAFSAVNRLILSQI